MSFYAITSFFFIWIKPFDRLYSLFIIEQKEEDETIYSKNQIDDGDSDKENTYAIAKDQIRTPKCRRELLLEMQNEKFFQLKRHENDNVDDNTNDKHKNCIMNDGNACAFNSDYCCMYYQQQQLQQQQQQQKKCFVAAVDDVAEYDYATNISSRRSNIYDDLYAIVPFTCKPKLCGGMREALYKPNTLENNLICNIPFTSKSLEQQQYYGSTTTSSTAESSPRCRPKYSLTIDSNNSTGSNNSNPYPYRTTSHFGFISPRQPPRADHKHVPLGAKEGKGQQELQRRYKPISRTISYDEIFATPRYQELCTSCFENLLRLKPELSAMASTATEGSSQMGGGACISEYNDTEKMITTTTITKQAAVLEPLPELDEYDEETPRKLLLVDGGEEEEINDTIKATTQINTVNKTIEKSGSTTFLSKIEFMNFSEESTDNNYIRTGDELNSISSDISLDDLRQCTMLQQQQQEQIEQKTSSGSSAPASTTSPRPTTTTNGETQTATMTGFTEYWNFGNWQKRPMDYNEREFIQPGVQPLTERRVIFEVTQCFDDGVRTLEERTEDVDVVVDDARMLMTRDERLRRKLEFQELWEDHIAFFRGKESLQDINVDEVTMTTTTTTTVVNDDTQEENKPVQIDAAVLGETELHLIDITKDVNTPHEAQQHLPQVQIEQDPQLIIMEISEPNIDKNTKDYENYERSRLPLLLSTCSERTSELETLSSKEPLSVDLHCRRLQADDDTVSFTSGIGQSGLPSSQAHEPPQIVIDDDNIYTNISSNTVNITTQQESHPKNSLASAVPQEMVTQLINQFENNLTLAGKNLNTIVKIVTNQYKTLQQETIRTTTPPPSTAEQGDQQEVEEGAAGYTREDVQMANVPEFGQEEDTESCFSTKTFNIEEKSPFNADITMIKDESDDKFVSANDSFEIEFNELHEEEENSQDQPEPEPMSHYITLENISLAADDMLTQMKDESHSLNAVSLCESFVSMDLKDIFSSEEQDNTTMEEYEEKQDTELTKELKQESDKINIEDNLLNDDLDGVVDDEDENNEDFDCVEEEEEEADNTSNTDLSQFSTLERKILKKIKKNQLKDEEEIFDKIENSIRNKMTPSKLEMIVHQQIEETFQTLTHVYDTRKPTCASTPKSEQSAKITKMSSFNFGNAFELLQQSLTNKIMLNSSNENNDDKQSLDDNVNITEPCCSKYVVNVTKSRLSRSLTPPPSTHQPKRSISSSTFTTCSGGIICKTYKTRGQRSHRRLTSSKSTEQPNDAISSLSMTKRRNFILENIKNASKPRPRATHFAQAQRNTKRYPTTFRQMVSSSSNALETESSQQAATHSSVCSFESKVVGSSPRLWVSVTRTPSKRTPKRIQRHGTNAKRTLNTSPTVTATGTIAKRRKTLYANTPKNKPMIKLQTDKKDAILLIDDNNVEAAANMLESNEDKSDKNIDSQSTATDIVSTTSSKQSIATFNVVETSINTDENDDIIAAQQVPNTKSCYSLESCESKMNIFVDSVDERDEEEVEVEQHTTMTRLTLMPIVEITPPKLYDEFSDFDTDPDDNQLSLEVKKIIEDLESLTNDDDNGQSITTDLDGTSPISYQADDVESIITEEEEEVVLNTTCTINNFVMHVTDDKFGQRNASNKGHVAAADSSTGGDNLYDELVERYNNDADDESSIYNNDNNAIDTGKVEDEQTSSDIASTLSETLVTACANLSLDRNVLSNIPEELRHSADEILLSTDNDCDSKEENSENVVEQMKNNRCVIFIKADTDLSCETSKVMTDDENVEVVMSVTKVGIIEKTSKFKNVNRTHETKEDEIHSDVYPVESSSCDTVNSSSSDTQPFNESSGATIIQSHKFRDVHYNAEEIQSTQATEFKRIRDVMEADSSANSIPLSATKAITADSFGDLDSTINPNHPFYEEVPIPLKINKEYHTNQSTIEEGLVTSSSSQLDDNYHVVDETTTTGTQSDDIVASKSTCDESVDDFLETSLPIPYPLKTNIFASSTSLDVDDFSDDFESNWSLHNTEAATGIDCVIEALGEEIDQITPRLINYKRKIDDLGEHVSKCARQMDECVVVQEDLKQQHNRLHEEIMLNQYAEELACKANTYSLSETDD